ncbi:MAG TPA: GGDEF domain-containing protein [Holophagaceae bacterium]
MDLPGPDREAEIRAQLVHDLYERGRVSILVLLVLVGVIRWAMDPACRVDERLRILFLVLIAVSLVRLAFMFVPHPRREELASTSMQYGAFAVGVSLTSVTLGAMMYLAWPQMEVGRIAILAVITSGLVSGAVMSLGFSPLVYMIYMLPPVGAMFFRALTDSRPPWGAEILATSFAIYAVAVFIISLDQRRTRREAIALSLTLSDLVVRDALTRLHNRRFLQEFMPLEAARLARDATDLEQGRQPERNTALGVYILDLDFFKQVNDTHGHAAGDAVLKQTAQVLSAALRRSDHVVRWGGEEFVAVAWVKQRDHVRVVAEKLRRAIEKTDFLLPDGKTLRKTVSVGFSILPLLPGQPRLLTWEQALALADAALYRAKAEGRNRWVGVGSAGPAWTDLPDAFGELLKDLPQAEAQGLVMMERSAPPS